MTNDNYKKKISKEEVNELPLFDYRGEIVVVENEHQADAALNLLLLEEVLGFDTESRPSFKKGEYYPVSLLQFSNATTAFLFRMHKIQFSPKLIDLLESPHIVKAGVALNNDLMELKKLKKFVDKGFVELHDLSGQLKVKNQGLRSLAAIFLNIRISKAAKLTNWENNDLSQAQLKYAATDAWVGRELYRIMRSLGTQT